MAWIWWAVVGDKERILLGRPLLKSEVEKLLSRWWTEVMLGLGRLLQDWILHSTDIVLRYCVVSKGSWLGWFRFSHQKMSEAVVLKYHLLARYGYLTLGVHRFSKNVDAFSMSSVSDRRRETNRALMADNSAVPFEPFSNVALYARCKCTGTRFCV